MLYQVVAKKMGVGSGYWHDRPYQPTERLADAVEQHANVSSRYPRPVAVVILVGTEPHDLQAQFEHYINDRPAKTVDPTTYDKRIDIEFAPLRDEYPSPHYLRRFADYAWGLKTFQQLLQLMVRVHHQELGGADDGTAPTLPTDERNPDDGRDDDQPDREHAS